MASFDFIPQRVPLNPLLDYADLGNKVSSMQLGESQVAQAAQTLRGETLKNDYTAAVQPAQINLLQQSIGDLTGSQTPSAGAAPAPTDTSLARPGSPMASASPGGALASSGGGDMTQLQGSESGGRPGVVNSQGYSGLFQFGTGRLADLKMYQPAPGENPNGNQWQGTITVPGFAPMSHQQFLANPDAQRAAMHVHVADIDQAIGQTPGADRMNRDGLVAVAHLGGVGGMQKFVASGGQYNPADSNGTHLSDYYSRYGQAGRAQLAADHGHPAGPLPGYDPSQANPFGGAGQPGGQAAASQAPMQLASNSGTAGMPQTATDASGGGFRAPPGAAPVPQDDTARASVRRIVAMQQMALAQPGGTGMRAAGQYQQALDAIAGPGGVVDPRTGNVYRVPGSYDTRFAASNATKAGEIGPAAQLHATNEGVTQAGAQQTFAVNAATKLNAEQVTPRAFSPTETYNTPAALGIGPGPVTGDALRRGTTTNAAALGVGAVAGGTTAQSQGGYQPPVNPSIVQGQDYETDRKEVGAIADAGQAARSAQVTTQTMRDLVARITPGATSKSLIEAAQQYLPKPVAASFATRAANMTDPEAAQEFGKLALQTAGTAERGVLGSRGGFQAIRLFQSANPSDALLPNTNQAILAKQLIGQQADADYAQGAQDHFSRNAQPFRMQGKAYDQPLSEYDRQWNNQRNPQVYAGAIGALAGLPATDGVVNGKPVKGWANGLSDDEYSRALQVVSRAAPNDTVQSKSGRLSMQPTQPSAAQPAPAPSVAPPASAVQHLMQNPALSGAFDQKYGAGAAARLMGR